jgi:hypothetical protein
VAVLVVGTTVVEMVVAPDAVAVVVVVVTTESGNVSAVNILEGIMAVRNPPSAAKCTIR